MATYNFNAGPAVLPRPVLEQVQAELLDYQGTGLSIMEMSHRGKHYEAINRQAEERMKRLLGAGDTYRVLFLQGGATSQFAVVPMNLLHPGRTADYLMTGAWADKAYEEAAKLGSAHIAGSTKDERYTRMPRQNEISLSDNPVYVHITSNETIQGTQWHEWPDVGDAPLVADMSSDILSRPIPLEKFGLIYGGAQKNIGPSGVTVVIIRNDLLEQARTDLPTMFQYGVHAKNNSLYNTPPTFGVYMANLVLRWLEDQGGLEAMATRNEHKAGLIYTAIARSSGFYRGHAAPENRSLMNITFRLPTPELEAQFVKESAAEGFVGLAGHRSVGGIRASVYNALPEDACAALATFMDAFAAREG